MRPKQIPINADKPKLVDLGKQSAA
jgi:hypothetical protein